MAATLHVAKSRAELAWKNARWLSGKAKALGCDYIATGHYDRARICLHEPQRAVTPGQAAVIYHGDVVLGGGWVCRTEPVRRYEALLPA